MAQIVAATISFLRKTFALERLPPPSAAPRGPVRQRAGLLRVLFAPEVLPRDPERPARPRTGWLRLLLAPEPTAAPPPTKSV